MEKKKVGEQIILKEDLKLTTEITGREKVYKKGNKVFVGAEGLIKDDSKSTMLHFEDGSMLPYDTEVDGFDTESIAKRIIARIKGSIPYLEEILESETSYDIDDLKDIIEEALSDDFGM